MKLAWGTWGVLGCWALFCVTWVVAARFVRPNKRLEGMRSQVGQGVLYVIGALLLRPVGSLGPLSQRLIPWGVGLQLAAVGLTATGIGFAFWARATLGRYWSSRVSLKEEHRLIQAGPYALVRNPIYAGLLVALCGTALLNAEPRSFLGVAFFLAAFAFKIRVEERFLAAEFGPAFDDYRRRVKSLVPFVG